MNNSRHCQCDRYERYITDILKAESEIAQSLSDFLKIFFCEIKYVEPIEKRVKLIDELLCAYTCKEKAMAELVAALKLNKNCCDCDPNCCTECNSGKKKPIR